MKCSHKLVLHGCFWHFWEIYAQWLILNPISLRRITKPPSTRTSELEWRPSLYLHEIVPRDWATDAHGEFHHNGEDRTNARGDVVYLEREELLVG